MMIVAHNLLTTALSAATDFPARAADRDSFVVVSPRDHRYFELTNGTPYIPIGFNLIGGGLSNFDRKALLDTMAKYRVNFIRIWLGGDGIWNYEHRSGEYDIEVAKVVKEFLDMAGARGIRVKLCIEQFWDIPSKYEKFADAPLHHLDNGGAYTSMNEFVTSEEGRAQYKHKLDWWQVQIGDHPAVFAWELWNEMNNALTSPWPRKEWIVWTQEMLPEAKKRFPRNLITQSLTSFGTNHDRSEYRTLSTMPANDIAQKLGSDKMANMVILGAFLELTKVIRPQSVYDSFSHVLDQRYHRLIGANVQMITAGIEYAAKNGGKS